MCFCSARMNGTLAKHELCGKRFPPHRGKSMDFEFRLIDPKPLKESAANSQIGAHAGKSGAKLHNPKITIKCNVEREDGGEDVRREGDTGHRFRPFC